MSDLSSITTARPVATSPQRWSLIDAARGAALVAMIIYHFAWDLSFYRYITVDVARHPAWAAFAATIAASFLFLVGVGFAFAARDGLNRQRYLRRLLMIAVAAALVSAATAIAMPEAPVRFGILHNIALSSLIAPLFLRAPIAVIAAAAAAVFAAMLTRSAAFDALWLTWLGLAQNNPAAIDHVPMIPWFGFVLAGLAAGRAMLEVGAFASMRGAIATWRANNPLARLLVAMGRWSLVIYLTHQIVLMAMLWPFAPNAAPPIDPADVVPFRAACEQSCRAQGANAPSCAGICECAINILKPTPYWARIVRDQLTSDEQTRISELTRQCAPARP